MGNFRIVQMHLIMINHNGTENSFDQAFCNTFRKCEMYRDEDGM